MGKRKHYTSEWVTVAAKLPLTEKERLYEICEDMGRTPSDVIHALIHMLIDDPVNVAIHLERHLTKVDAEKEERARERRKRREYRGPEELGYTRYVREEWE